MVSSENLAVPYRLAFMISSGLVRKTMGGCLSEHAKAQDPLDVFVPSSCSKTEIKDGFRSSGHGSQASSASGHLMFRTEGEILELSNVKAFNFSNLKAATRNFRPDSVLGEGGFGSVYKGWVDESSLTACKAGTGIAVAVKRLNQEGTQGHREWLTEVNYLGQLNHPNLVRLIGYCLEDEHRLLVYEFMPRGNLANHLFRRGSYFQTLSWSLRMKVALGAARGLAYLHSEEAKVIFRDFKTSNILLDSDYTPKLSDFGLAKDGPVEKTHVSTRVMGTYGYAAPEYIATGHLTTKSDVYSFGVVLLEMLSGRRVIDKNRPQGEQNLVEWARRYLPHKHKLLCVLDTRLEGQYSADEVQQAASLAFRCLSLEARLRPAMDDVVASLEKLASLRRTSEQEQPEPHEEAHWTTKSKMVRSVNQSSLKNCLQQDSEEGGEASCPQDEVHSF